MFVSKYYSMSISRSKFSFVGCLTTDPLLFVWDQYLITSDVPKFHDELIPAIAAAMIITLRDFLLKCKMVRYNHIEIFFLILFIEIYFVFYRHRKWKQFYNRKQILLLHDNYNR
jgi:hypothetical protein